MLYDVVCCRCVSLVVRCALYVACCVFAVCCLVLSMSVIGVGRLFRCLLFVVRFGVVCCLRFVGAVLFVVGWLLLFEFDCCGLSLFDFCCLLLLIGVRCVSLVACRSLFVECRLVVRVCCLS